MEKSHLHPDSSFRLEDSRPVNQDLRQSRNDDFVSPSYTSDSERDQTYWSALDDNSAGGSALRVCQLCWRDDCEEDDSTVGEVDVSKDDDSSGDR